MHRLDRQQESLQLNAAHMDTRMLGTLLHQQDTKSLNQELSGTKEDNSSRQYKVNCQSEKYLQRC